MYPNSLHLILFNLIFLSSTYAYNDKRYDNCAPINSTCGFLQEIITYPFWKPNDFPQYCGHPGFKLDCQGNTLVIEIVNQTFSVLDINYKANTLTLLNPQFSSDDDTCPRTQSQLTNTTLDLTLFNFTSGSQNATLYYDCIDAKHEKIVPYNFTCPSSDHPVRGYSTPVFKHGLGFFVLDEKSEDEVEKDCGLEVYVPVLKTEVLRLLNGSSTIVGVLNKGFEVKWMIDTRNCKDCLDSGGRCGYNSTLDEPVCFCPNGAYSTNCHESSGRLDQTSTLIDNAKATPKTTIYIGAGVAAAISIILMCILGFLYTQRHKWQHRYMLPAYVAKSKASMSNRSYSSSRSDLQGLNGSSYFGVQLFSYRELEHATDFFSPSKELGEGGFGTVYYAKLGDGREVAIKRLYENSNKRAQQFMNEVEILAHLRHKNLVTLYGCTSRQSRELLLVYEYVPNGTVADHLRGQKAKFASLPWPTRLSIAVETANALLYLHASDIIHRDVKTQNILLDKDFSVKVADFGLSRLFPLDVTHVSTAPQGTPGYVDPEYYQCYHLTEKSDVYSFGVVLAELISSKPAVDITRRRQDINLSNMAMDKIQNNALHEFVDSSLGFETDSKVKKEMTAVAELAFRCLQGTREMRPSMEQVLGTLRGVKDNQNKEDKAEVVDISEDDMYILKSDLSPGSTPMGDNSAGRHILHASV